MFLNFLIFYGLVGILAFIYNVCTDAIAEFYFKKPNSMYSLRHAEVYKIIAFASIVWPAIAVMCIREFIRPLLRKI